MISYAQNFEDVILQRLFSEVDAGFYVDVGAWDPKVHSVTQHFYTKGWSGVNVEPLRERFQLFLADRPRDINLNCAIGAQPGRLHFYECLDDTALSTVDEKVAQSIRDRGLTVEEYDVDAITLNSIFENHCPATVDFLKIDVEGLEGRLLESFDLSRFRPRALIVESTVPATGLTSFTNFDDVEAWSSWEPGVLANGYVFAHFDGLNRFYLRAEDGELAGRTKLPPGIFDDFQLYTHLKYIADVDADRAEKDKLINELSKRIAVIEDDRQERLNQILELTEIINKNNEIEVKSPGLMQELKNKISKSMRKDD